MTNPNGVIQGISSSLSCKRLAAFDFDNTIVNLNTDTVVRDIVGRDQLPKSIEMLIDKSGWTEYMQEVFRILHADHGITEEKIRQTIRAVPEVPGFVKLLKSLHSQDFDLIIISDSNSVFINEWLEAHDLSECFTEIFTNPAHFDDDGLLNIKRFHTQTECKLSAANLCKGKVLQDFIHSRDVFYNQVIYFGDGNNDICPVLKLGREDIACARIGYGMAKNLEKNKNNIKLKAKLLHWKDGFDLIRQLHEQNILK